MKSTAHNMAPKPCVKGVSAEVGAVESTCWQFGEYPPCCRRNAEGYQIKGAYSRLLFVQDSFPKLSFFNVA